MAMVVTFRVPADACATLVPGFGTPAIDDKTIKAAIKNVIAAALESKAEPVAIEIPPSVQTVRVNLSLKDHEAKQIREVAKSLGVPESIACQRLIMGVAQSSPGAAAETMPRDCELLEDAWQKTKRDPRVAQAQVFLNLRGAFSDGQIAMVEAATGVGKSLAMLLAAEERLRSIPDSRVVIAVPTLAVMRQFVSTHRNLVNSGFSIHPIETLFGRREFVSMEVLQDIMDNPKYLDYRAAISSWIALQGESLPDAVFEKPWLTATLRQIAPGFPVEACVIPDLPQETDPGYLAYLRQFDHHERSTQEILLCTHAMLSISTKLRHWAARRDDRYKDLRSQEISLLQAIKKADQKSDKASLQEDLRAIQSERLIYGAEISEDAGKLPPFRYLMVDEAHLLESSMSSANASYLPLHTLLRKAVQCHESGLGVTANKMAAIRSAIDRIKSLGSSTKADTVFLGDDTRDAALIREAITDLLDATAVGRVKKKDIAPSDKHLLAQLEYGRAVLKSALLVRGARTRASLKFSPIREFPQLYVGASRVDGLLSSLWASVKAAACVSATLYVAKKDGFSSNYQRKILAIPEGRAKDCAPVTPLWVYEAVSVSLPLDSDTIRPPSRSDKLSAEAHAEKEAAWLQTIAVRLTDVHATAAGGVLVLMTSYDSIKKLRNLLPKPVHDVSVIASPDASLAEQSIAFLKMAISGQKPLWLATGAAWTGLDIGGHEPLRDLLGKNILPAGEDNVLTDLVIPRLPFGINRSITHEHRIMTDPRTPWEVLDMLFRLKQGVGRLVRRQGLPSNRRIFFLDSRIYSQNMAYVQDQVTLLFRGYRNLG